MSKFFAKKKLLAFALISILSVFSSGMISPIEMRFLSYVTESSSLASFAFTFGTAASVLGSIFVGHWANKYGKWRTLLTFLFASIIIPVLYSSVQSTLQAYGVKFSWAFSLAVTSTILMAFLQGEVYSELCNQAGTFFGILYSIQSGAGAVGSLCGGLLTDKFGFFSVFFGIAIISIVQFILLVFLCRDNRTSEELSSVDTSSSRVDLLTGIKFIWTNLELRARFILMTSFGISWSTKVILYPLIVFAITSSNTKVSAVMSIQGIIAMIALPYIGRMVDKIGYSKILWFGYTTLGIAVLTFSLSPNLVLIWIASGLIAVGESCNGPAMAALEVNNIPNHLRNSVIAIQNIYSTLVEILFTSLTGMLLFFMMPQSIMLAMSISIFLSLILAIFITRSKGSFTIPDSLNNNNCLKKNKV